MSTAYYSPTTLLSQVDIEGNRPEIYLANTNRSAGKTTAFSKMLVNNFKKKGNKFILLYRYRDELSDVSDKFFKEIGSLFFPRDEMTEQRMAKGQFIKLLLNDEVCGYALALNTASKIKRYSHLFGDVSDIFFDEFQDENNRYCPDEINKFISLHTSVARGGGSQSRYVRCILAGNLVSILNPYYDALGVTEKLRGDTRFCRGTGWVCETSFNESAGEAQAESSFNKAFRNTTYAQNLTGNFYLNDNTAMIRKTPNANRYVCSLVCGDDMYAIRESNGMYYVGKKADPNYPVIISKESLGASWGLPKNDAFKLAMRSKFDDGLFRFEDMRAKNATVHTLSY